MTSDNVQIELRLGSTDDDAKQVDQLTRDLLAELREQPVESAELLRSGRAPARTKFGGDFTLPAIALTLGGHVSAPFAWNILKQVLDRLRHRKNVVIKIDGPIAGRDIQFEGPPAEFEKLLAALAKPLTESRPTL